MRGNGKGEEDTTCAIGILDLLASEFAMESDSDQLRREAGAPGCGIAMGRQLEPVPVSEWTVDPARAAGAGRPHGAAGRGPLPFLCLAGLVSFVSVSLLFSGRSKRQMRHI